MPLWKKPLAAHRHWSSPHALLLGAPGSLQLQPSLSETDHSLLCKRRLVRQSQGVSDQSIDTTGSPRYWVEVVFIWMLICVSWFPQISNSWFLVIDFSKPFLLIQSVSVWWIFFIPKLHFLFVSWLWLYVGGYFHVPVHSFRMQILQMLH